MFNKSKEDLELLNENAYTGSIFTNSNQYINKEMICYCKLKGTDEGSKEMCQLFDELKTKSMYLTTLLAVFIAVSNYLFRSILVYLVEFLELDTYTEETYLVKAAVFSTTFMNSGILIILMSAHSKSPIFKSLFKGEYADFTPDWFENIGTIIITNLFINALYPLIELVIHYVKLMYLIMTDQRTWVPWKL